MQIFSTPISICNKTINRNDISLEYPYIAVLVTVLYNLGQLHVQTGEDKDQKWDSYVDGVWEVVDDACKGSIRLLVILHNLGHIQYHRSCYKEAMTTYTQALNAA
eukprot:5624163-Ditylum_brightwellii.AAC.1